MHTLSLLTCTTINTILRLLWENIAFLEVYFDKKQTCYLFSAHEFK